MVVKGYVLAGGSERVRSEFVRLVGERAAELKANGDPDDHLEGLSVLKQKLEQQDKDTETLLNQNLNGAPPSAVLRHSLC